MITVKFGNYYINGTDKSGKVEQLPDAEARRMVSLGYATLAVNNTPTEPKRQRGKRRGSKT